MGLTLPQSSCQVFGRKKWPLYRGRRSGKRVKDSELYRRHYINKVQPRAPNRVFTKWRTCEPNNCVSVPTVKESKTHGSKRMFVPAVMLSNVMSLAPKIDEIRVAIKDANVDVACFTETWLREHINDNVIAIPGYNIIRRDRKQHQHGGVCMYINKTIKCEILDELSDEKFEVIWVKLRPYRLPRGMSCIVVANVYHPQTECGASDAEMLSFLYESMSSIEARFPSCGFLIAGDFNRLDTSGFQNAFQLKQSQVSHPWQSHVRPYFYKHEVIL